MIIALLATIILLLVYILKVRNKTVNTYLKPLEDYTAMADEILEVEKQIAEKGFWEEHTEWRIFTVTSSKIEPQEKEGKIWYIVTVKCEQEVMIPAKTIERAIVFKKIYAHFQAELWSKQGWASWTQKDNP
ncbi:MAG: hypothetical protein L6Q78_07135 [Bacteroidia bacterium]|nr:hypothetical protein [Bacteroidia bacterium]